MKLKNCHIMYDPNKDNVVILHRPFDGSPMQALEATHEFIHATLQWAMEAQLARGFFGRHWDRLQQALLKKTRSTRIVRDGKGAIYTIVTTKKEGRHAEKCQDPE